MYFFVFVFYGYFNIILRLRLLIYFCDVCFKVVIYIKVKINNKRFCCFV